MPKRKHSDESEQNYLTRKLRKLERKIQRSRRKKSRSSSRETTQEVSVGALLDSPLASVSEENQHLVTLGTELTGAVEQSTSTENAVPPIDEALDSELLEILGDDPTHIVQYGKDIHPELASRLQHYAVKGLTKELRKELNERYLVPSNCVHLGAPLMNAEIKAAVTEVVIKRDKGIEARQKQLAAAISCVAGMLTRELKDKDNTRLKELMNACRILCDIQHAESVTRRNFAIFSIKKELKEHLVNTNIDKWLFGENLAETLKTAKAVTKSGTELKTKLPPKPKPTSSSSNLNWKGPAPARKQPGAQRGREAAPPPAPGPQVRSSRCTTHANSWKQSQHQSKLTRRR